MINPPNGSLAIIGAGPRGTGLLERLAANIPLLHADRPLRIHLIDPFPAGAGKVWRYTQSPFVTMNSMAEDVTMFTDSTVVCDGPIVDGPTLAEWAAGDSPICQDDLDQQRRDVDGFSFPTRQLQSEYLAWVWRRAAAALPANAELIVHRAAAVDLTERPDGRQLVWLDGRNEPVVADIVVLAMGHLDTDPDPEHVRLAEFAHEHGLFYQPPAFFDDSHVEGIQPSQHVVARGFGLAFIDILAMLTEGRGGRYESGRDSRLVYRPSGREPIVYVGSRRGVPYQSKIEYRLPTPLPPLPRFLTPTALPNDETSDVELNRDVLPLVRKELGWAYYHQLFTAHPGRVLASWTEFAAEYEKLDWDSPERSTLVARTVPDSADRLDFDRLDRPLSDRRYDSFERQQEDLRRYIRENRARHANPEFSADLALFEALLAVLGPIGGILGRLSGRSRAVEFPLWFKQFSYLASGPPGHRLDQLAALSEAGIVRFLGADMWLTADSGNGVFQAGSASTTETINATGLIEARLPAPSVSRSRDQLISRLFHRGECAEETPHDTGTDITYNTGRLRVVAQTGQVICRNGQPHRARFAFGAFTNGGSADGFTRPRRNGLFFRQNDIAARRFLTTLSGLHSGCSAA